MKTRLFFLILFSLTAFSAQAQFDNVKKSLAQKPMQDQYMEFLSAKGYSPEVDKDGDIKFTYNSRRYYITLDVKDKQFFRIARIANLNLKTPAKISLAKEICHDLTKDLKVTKVYWSNGQLWSSSEQLVAEPDDFKAIFVKTLRLTETAYNKFVKTWKEKDN